MNDDTLYLLIVGSRNFDNFELLKEELDKIIADYDKTIIISGGAKGADYLAELYADRNHLGKIIMKADWNKYGKSAGYVRNREMHKFISEKKNRLCVAFWDGKSKGTTHSFDLANIYNNPIKIIIV